MFCHAERHLCLTGKIVKLKGMENMYEKLFSRGRIGNLELKSRIVMPPMGTSMAAMNGEASDRIIRYYEERAKAGCGLICTEVTCVDEDWGCAGFYQLHASSMRYAQSLKKLADAVHKYDTKIFLQLHHPGREINSIYQGKGQIVAPSAIPCPVCREMPHELTTAECEGLVNKFVAAAKVAKMAGMDGVELHAAHGYLINQFLSPHTNKRTDKYGGDFFGRMRFIDEIVINIRMQLPGFPVSVRYSADEFLPDGITLEEGVKIARHLESIGVVSLNVSCGTYETGNTIVEPYFRKEMWKKHLAASVKAAVKIPVIAVNTVKYPATAEKLLEEGVCDFVALGRAQLADPEWAKKTKEGNEKLIRKCMGCMFCFKSALSGMPIICNANPTLGLEELYNEDTLKKDGNGRTIAVIGGGPAGMQAAQVMARRGYKPVIFEKGAELGGQMNIAKLPENKEMLGELVKTLIAQTEDLGIEVRLNTEASIEDIKALNPAGVIVAAGSKPFKLPVPGADKENVSLASDVLLGNVRYENKSIVVVGAGVTGIETAETLAIQGNKVTIIEMGTAVGDPLYPSLKAYYGKRLAELGVEIKTMTRLFEICDDKVVVRNSATAFRGEIPCDAVVFANGVRSERTVAEACYANFDKVICVGDVNNTGLIGDALRDANSKAWVF